MNERLLQYIWLRQYFNTANLHTAQMEALMIMEPGALNTNQGPDFLEAKIRVNHFTWVGNVELHIKTSDWNKHAHGDDPNYKNVILHVVWENDDPSITHPMPLLVLQPLASTLLLKTYQHFMNLPLSIPCAFEVTKVDTQVWTQWKEKLMIERLEQKETFLHQLLKEAAQHWEHVFWWTLARNFGMKVNGDAFERVAKSLPLKILAQHKYQLHQLEALLLGQAGLLNEAYTESYPVMLQKEYRYLQKKLQLHPAPVQLQFLRMRPALFPGLKLAQLAVLIHQSTHLFSKILDAARLDELYELLKVTANDYWHYHYHFDNETAYLPKKTGKAMLQNIILNTVIPLLFTYANYHQLQPLKLRITDWLRQLPGEQNTITSHWKKLGVPCGSAFDSQALLQLKKQYCDKKRCLECAIGNAILKKVV